MRRGAWNRAGGGGDNYFFFRQGDDLLITRRGGEFVTMFPGGSTNAWFKDALDWSGFAGWLACEPVLEAANGRAATMERVDQCGNTSARGTTAHA